MLEKIHDLLCDVWQRAAMKNDRRFRGNCDFSGWMSQEEAGFTEREGNKYQPASDKLVKVLEHFPVKVEDSILDIGCGKGKAMYLMSRLPFGTIRGYDLSGRLVDIANDNFHRLGVGQCHAFQANAMEFDGYDDFNYFFIFNSFPQEVFEVMMGRLVESLKRKPRKCVFIYLHPVCHQYIVTQTPFRLVYKKRALTRWYDYFCYENVAE
ncbi:MAG: class I SAM-dependent methyltransferase [Eubacteriales bacterium]|nr:class I SAM-dependent methyltransferase [Eubacteriales bacterium]